MSGTKKTKNGEGKMKTKLFSIVFTLALLISMIPMAYAENQLPTTTSLIINPSSANVGEPISFTTVAFDSDGRIVSYAWDFGDGNTKTTTSGSTTHVYTNAGNKFVSVSACDNDGGCSAETGWVQIETIGLTPYVSLQATPTSGDLPLVVTFVAVAADPNSEKSISSYEWDFDGDGSPDKIVQSSSTTNTQVKTYATAGNHFASVTVKNKYGGASDSQWISVNQPDVTNMIAAITANPTSGTAPLKVQFTGTATNLNGATVTGYAWDFNNDGKTDSTSANPSYTFTTKGNKKVTLAVSNSQGKTASAEAWIEVEDANKAPYVSLQASPTSGEMPLTVTFTAVATDDDGSIASYAWDFDGDGVTDSTAQTTTHTFTKPGNNFVTVTVKDNEGAGASDSTWIQVIEKMELEIVSDPSSGMAPLLVDFSAISNANIVKYEWDFNNDGTVDSTSRTPRHIFTEAGNKKVTLKAKNDKGDEATAEAWIQVEDLNEAPYVSLQASPTSGEAPLTVTFTAVAEDSDGEIVSYAWDFNGDGVTDSTAQTPTHTFTNPGNYFVAVTVKDNDGAGASDTTWIMADVPGKAPYVSLQADKTTGKLPLIVNFDAIAQDDDGEIVEYAWDFNGDGVTDSTLKNPTKTFNTEGNYFVVVTVKDNDGMGASDSTWIQVEDKNEAPFVTLTANKKEGYTPLTVTFTAQAYDTDGQIVEYAWDFDGDGKVDSNAKGTATYTYTREGEYFVVVTVKDDKGAGASDSTWIETEEGYDLIVQLNADKTLVEVPDEVTFTATVTSSTGKPIDVISYEWDFDGDGSIDRIGTSSVAVKTYTVPDVTNLAKVTVHDSNGLSGSDDQVISTFIIVDTECMMPFVKGWNYVELPELCHPNNNSIDFVLQDLDYEIAWKDNSNTWQFYLPSEDVGEFNTIDHGINYWILSNEDKNLTVPGKIIS